MKVPHLALGAESALLGTSMSFKIIGIAVLRDLREVRISTVAAFAGIFDFGMFHDPVVLVLDRKNSPSS